MSSAARILLFGILLVVLAVISYAMIEWPHVLANFPHHLRSLKRAVAVLLKGAYYAAYGVPVLLFLVAVIRFATAKSGRALIAWKLFAYLTLWAIGSLAFFFGLFLAYAPSSGDGGSDLLVPALLGCLGYVVIGVGFLVSVSRRG